MGTSAIYILEYLAGLFFFGFIRWILDGILVEFQSYSLTGSVYDLASYLWWIAIGIYLIFGIWYLIIQIKTWKIFGNQ